MAASANATAAKMLNSTMLKFCRAIVSEMTCSIGRSREIGISPSTACTSRAIATRNDAGLAVRTAHDNGMTVFESCVSPSGTWL